MTTSRFYKLGVLSRKLLYTINFYMYIIHAIYGYKAIFSQGHLRYLHWVNSKEGPPTIGKEN